jgi:formate dehydrogenase maturation protein FdhE
MKENDFLEARLKPCPFCGSTDVRKDIMYWDDEKENPGIECLECDAVARPEWWNKRHDCDSN